mgnify:FL=1
MAKKLTAAALTEMVTALRDKIAGAKYMVDGQWRETAVTSCEIGTDGKLYVGLMLQPTAAEIVTQVALTDSAGAVLAQAEESIAGSNTDTGVYYRFRVSVTEGE